MPTEPQQDRNVEALNADTVQEIRNLARMSKAGNRYATENLGSLIVRNLDVILAPRSLPSQPPQNVKVGDAVKQAEIDYANRREEDTRPMDAVKGVMEEFNKFISLWSGYRDDERLERCKGFAARLRLALSTQNPTESERVLRDEIHRLKLDLTAARDHAKGDVWFWDVDGENHLDSLTCPVVIRAEDFRLALSARNDEWLALVAENAALVKRIDEAEAIPRSIKNNNLTEEQTVINSGRRVYVLDDRALSATSSHDGKATGDDARGGDGELVRQAGELQATYTNSNLPIDERLEARQSLSDLLFNHIPAIIAASANAKRLKVAEGLLREIAAVLEADPCGQQFASERVMIAEFLSPAPTQTPGDERQG